MAFRGAITLAMSFLLYAPVAAATEATCGAAAIAIEGIAVEQGDHNALASLKLRAEQGDALAQTRLAALYDSGLGVKKDYVFSARWYLAAARKGFAPAQNNISQAYASGRGVPKNHAEAHKWILAAAEQGFATAQWNLSMDYQLGIGVNIRSEEAYFWASLAAMTDSTYLTGRDEVAAHLRRDKKVAVETRLKTWRAKPTQATVSAKAMEKDIAQIIGHDLGAQQEGDITRLVSTLKSQAVQGDSCAQDILGDIYNRGELGVPKSHDEAVRWWRKAAEQGHQLASHKMALPDAPSN